MLGRAMSKSMNAHSNKQAGFTIIELLIATGVFAVLLLVITAGIINFTRQYYKGIVSSNTQSTARAVMSEVTQAIQFGGVVTTGLSNGSARGFCVDSKVFSYIIGQEVIDNGGSGANQGYHGLVVDTNDTTCSSATLPTVSTTAALGPNTRELLAERMRLSNLTVTDNGNDTYTVHVRVLYGDDDVLQPSPSIAPVVWSNEKCGASFTSSQYCAISDLTTTIQKRVQ